MKVTKHSTVMIEISGQEVAQLRNFLKNAMSGGLTSKFDEPLIKEMYEQLAAEEQIQ